MEENTVAVEKVVKQKSFPKNKFLFSITIVSIATLVGYIHYRYVSHLFENDRNFAYLSELEREMSFRTEMGFYYSYYKTLVHEKPFVAGISKLMFDKSVEHPKEVNAFNRFNIHPEVLIAALYRYFEVWLNTTEHRQCHIIDRGHDLSPVESCVGLGQPIYFYLEAIWLLAGLNVTALFLHATALSNSILGGIFTVMQYFANHSECTRVMWAPNERENMAGPLLILQCWLVSMQLRDRERKSTFPLQISIFLLNCLCLLCWQFTQFIFLTQTAIFFVMEQIRVIDTKTLCVLLHSHFCGLHTAILLLQGNDMLKSSLYASFFAVVSVYALLFSSFRLKVENRLDVFVEAWLVLLRLSIVTCLSVYLKSAIGDFFEMKEDGHVWELLASKLTDYKSFHTMIYTCSEVFDFLPLGSFVRSIGGALLPSALTAIALATNYTIKETRSKIERKIDKEIDVNSDDGSDSGIDSSDVKTKKSGVTIKEEERDSDIDEIRDGLVRYVKGLSIDPAVCYNLMQLVAYGLMAGLVMRLKLLFVPQLCIISSLLFNTEYHRYTKPYYLKYVIIICNIWSLVNTMYLNVTKELSHIGEFSDPPLEELLNWIMRETSPSAAFAGSMPLLATVLLSTRRPVVAHPHYEHYEARERAYSVYKMYGRFSAEEIYEELNKLKVTYVVVETKYCYGRSKKGCSFQDIWDVEVPARKRDPSSCLTLLLSPAEHLYPVFRNQHYAVFNVHDYSVRYMPRSFVS